MNRYMRVLARLKNKLEHSLNSIHIKSLNNTSLFVLLRAFITSLSDGWITMRASAISFNFFMAIPPIVLFVFSVLPYFQLTNLYEEVSALIEKFMPTPIQSQLLYTINEIINVPNSGFISISLLLTLIFASNGFLGILNAFNSSVQVQDIRSWWKQQATAILLLLITIFVMVVVIVFLNIHEVIHSFWGKSIIDKNILLSILLKTISVVVILSFVYIEVRMLFYFGTVGTKNLSAHSLPSIITTVIIAITSVGFNYYISNFSRYNVLYGSIGTIMLLLLWLYINAIVLIAGFELHISFLNAKTRPLQNS